MNLISKIREYKDSDFFKNVLNLMSGTFLAQIVIITSTPVLSRFFSPDDFGILALFISIHSILVILGTSKLEIAIMLPKRLKSAFKLVSFIIFQSFLLTNLLYIILLFIEDYLLKRFEIEQISKVIYLLPVSMFLMSINTAVKYLKNRFYKYQQIRNCTIVEGVSRGGINILIGAIKPINIGLVYGYFSSLFVSSFFWLKEETCRLIH